MNRGEIRKQATEKPTGGSSKKAYLGDPRINRDKRKYGGSSNTSINIEDVAVNNNAGLLRPVLTSRHAAKNDEAFEEATTKRTGES